MVSRSRVRAVPGDGARGGRRDHDRCILDPLDAAQTCPEIALNARGNLFGPGFQANATVGRAVRLIMTTIGGGTPQQADKSTLGNPAKYTCCFAENEADSPWEPLHVQRGFAASTSTVTAFGGAAPDVPPPTHVGSCSIRFVRSEPRNVA